MQVYQIKVGDFTLKGEFSENEANKIQSSLKHCIKDEIELIPIKQGVTV